MTAGARWAARDAADRAKHPGRQEREAEIVRRAIERHEARHKSGTLRRRAMRKARRQARAK